MNWLNFNHRSKNHGSQNCGFVTVSLVGCQHFRAQVYLVLSRNLSYWNFFFHSLSWPIKRRIFWQIDGNKHYCLLYTIAYSKWLNIFCFHVFKFALADLTNNENANRFKILWFGNFLIFYIKCSWSILIKFWQERLF